MGIFVSTVDFLWFGNESPRRCKVFSKGGTGRGALRGEAETESREGRGRLPGAVSPGSAPFPDSHLQGQDAVVPHKRLAVTTSFRSLSGFPATIKGHVCRREEGGGGKWQWRRGGVGSQQHAGGWQPAGETLSLQFTRCPGAPHGWIKQKAAWTPNHGSGW